MTNAKILASLGPVAFEASCVVADDPGEVVRHAAPLDAQAAAQIREQAIARLCPDPAAVQARERRIAIEHNGKVRAFARRRGASA